HPDQTLAPAPAAPASAPGSVVFGGTRPGVGEPELIQGYSVLRPLGQGGLGRVLLARDNVLNRLVAIKDFFPSLPDAARAQAADGVHSAHTQGVVHRDPKPSNVMVEEESGRAVVIDWGLARVTGAVDHPAPGDPGEALGFPADPGLTHEGAVLGTPAYMSP